MKRKLFTTAVVLLVMATPLFGAQALATQKPEAKAASATPKPEAKAQPAAPKPAAVSVTTQKPAAASAVAKAAPAPPKAPSVKVNDTPKPATAAKAHPQSQPATPKPAGAKAEPKPATAVKAHPQPQPATPKPAGAKAQPKPATAAKAHPQSQPATPKPAGAKAEPKPATAAKAAKAVPAKAELSPVQAKVHANKELTRELQTRLPGADVVNAASGFKDLQQYVSAAHAAHNLGISFESLKAKLLAGKRTSLRQAIQDVKPAASAAVEAQRAEYDAIGMILATEQAAATSKPAPTAVKAPAKPAAKAAAVVKGSPKTE